LSESLVRKSYCRFCQTSCGIEATITDGRVTAVRGDPEHPMSQGYSCVKGRSLPEQLYAADRLLHSRRRGEDGRLEPIASEPAVSQIAEQLQRIVDSHGPRAVALFNGTGAYMNSVGLATSRGWLGGLGSPSYYTCFSIDQPAKVVAPQIHGSFMAGGHSFDTSDVWMVVGQNPPVSGFGGVSGFPSFNSARRIRDARRRGLKLIVVDPRRSELARLADLHLAVRPGEDPSLLAGVLRVILEEELHDREFCARFVDGVEELSAAVAPFTLEYVERRTGVAAELVERAARMFGAGPRGMASAGTGPCMAPRPNLSEHLVISLCSLCGRYNRAGDRVANPGVLNPPRPFREQAVSPMPGFGLGPQPRIRGLGQLVGELPTAALAEEILEPGPGQVRALIVVGGDPILTWPDQPRVRRALEALELLVCLDFRLTATTAHFAHYAIAVRHGLERPDVTTLTDAWYPEPFAHYTEALVEPPADSDVMHDWEFFWGLASRMQTPLSLPGDVAVQTDRRPTPGEMLRLLTSHARIPLEEIAPHPSGKVFDASSAVVEPAADGGGGRLQVAPESIAAELREVAAEPLVAGAGYRPGEEFTHRLISRRMDEVNNSSGSEIPSLRARHRFNPAYMNPADLDALGLGSGARIEIRSDYGHLPAIAEATPDVPPGVISMAHGWGDLPERDDEVAEIGSCVGRLIDTTRDYDPISGIPRQSAIPVNVRALGR